MRYINISKERICLLEGSSLEKHSVGKTLAMCFKELSKGNGAVKQTKNMLPKEQVCPIMQMKLWVLQLDYTSQ